MLNDMFKDITSIFMAIVGVAILYTLVNPHNKTSDVIKTASGGFSQALSAAMGNTGSAAGGNFYGNQY